MARAGRSYEEINFQIPTIKDADQSFLSLIWNLKSGIWNSYGMAPAGRSYEEILKTYFQGVQIRKAY